MLYCRPILKLDKHKNKIPLNTRFKPESWKEKASFNKWGVLDHEVVGSGA